VPRGSLPGSLGTMAEAAKPTGRRYEVKFANGETADASTLGIARHLISERVAFDANWRAVLPAEIWTVGRDLVGGRSFVELVEQPPH
jgi:hypothetical protein